MIPEQEIIKAFESQGIKIDKIEPIDVCSIVTPSLQETVTVEDLLKIAEKLDEDPGVIVLQAGSYELQILI